MRVFLFHFDGIQPAHGKWPGGRHTRNSRMKLFSFFTRKTGTTSDTADTKPPPDYEGMVTHVNDEYVAGWAWNRAQPDEVVEVLAETGGSTKRVRADRSLYMLLKKRMGSGNHSFKIRYAALGMPADGRLRILLPGPGACIYDSAQEPAPKPFAPSDIDARSLCAEAYIAQGQGVEIGALYKPIRVGRNAKVFYVEKYDDEKLKTFYIHDANFDVDVDIVDEAEKLENVKPGSMDFVICCSCLEHLENPLGAIRNHMRVLKPGGLLYYTLPDMRFTFDKPRETTTFEHLVRDDREGPANSRAGHYREWAEKVLHNENPDAEAARLMEAKHDIHFHTWTCHSLSDMLSKIRAHFDDALELLAFHRNTFDGENEMVIVMQKQA